MITLTKQQRIALKKIYDRGTVSASFSKTPLSYREFRKTVQGYPGGDCVLVPWCGMWLGIEKDGYTHS